MGLFDFIKKKEKVEEKEKITKEYLLINKDEKLLKRYFENNQTILYVTFMPYQSNSKIKIFTEENEPIGEIEESLCAEAISLNIQHGVLFLTTEFDDNEGIFKLKATISCSITKD